MFSNIYKKNRILIILLKCVYSHVKHPVEKVRPKYGVNG